MNTEMRDALDRLRLDAVAIQKRRRRGLHLLGLTKELVPADGERIRVDMYIGRVYMAGFTAKVGRVFSGLPCKPIFHEVSEDVAGIEAIPEILFLCGGLLAKAQAEHFADMHTPPWETE